MVQSITNVAHTYTTHEAHDKCKLLLWPPQQSPLSHYYIFLVTSVALIVLSYYCKGSSILRGLHLEIKTTDTLILIGSPYKRIQFYK